MSSITDKQNPLQINHASASARIVVALRQQFGRIRKSLSSCFIEVNRFGTVLAQVYSPRLAVFFNR
jgi:hypothetical protein